MKNIIFLLLGMLIFSVFIPVIQAYIIDEDRVYWENSYGKITVWPHTSYGLIEHIQYANITSYLPAQNLDFAFEFDFAVSGDVYLLQGGEWIDKTYLFEHDIYNGKHFYWIKNVNFAQDEMKEVRWTYRTPINTSGKWELWIKRSSDTIQEALNNSYYVNLDPWWNSSWNYKIPIYVNQTGSITLIDFPVNVTYNLLGLITDGKLDDEGKCLRFINSTETSELDFEFESYTDSSYGLNGTTHTQMWVEVDSLPSTNTTIYMYYGSECGVGFGNNTEATWNSDYNAVYHLGENSGNHLDSTSNNNDATLTNVTQQGADIGIFDGADEFDGTDNRIDVDTSASLEFTSNFTLDFWAKPDSGQTEKPLISKYGNLPASQSWHITDDDLYGISGIYFVAKDSGNNLICGNLNSTYTYGSWTHIAITVDNENCNIYKNGVLDNTVVANGNDIRVVSQSLRLGQFFDISHRYDGVLDEVRLSNATRSADWILRSYQQDLIAFGVEERNITKIDIISPENITYYNINSVSLNVTNVSFIADIWWYSINNDSNVTFTPNITLRSIFLGSNNLIVYANSTNGTNYSASVTFTLDTACSSSSYIDNTTCSGRDMNYVAVCKQLGKTIFQWDFDNLTFCQYGCFNGACIIPVKTCRDRCQDNQTTCSGNNIIQCVNQSTGCFDWSDENTTFCRLGCIDGVCVEGVSLCSFGDTRCQDNRVVWCDDDDGDGFYDWSKSNFTECRFGCIETMNETTGIINVTCNIHSFDLPYDARNIFTYFGRGLNYIFDTLHLQLVFILFMMLVVGGLLGIVTGNWIGGLVGSLFVGFIGLIIWIPALFYVFILIAMIGGLVLLLTNR